LRSIDSSDIADTSKVSVTAQVLAPGRRHDALEQIVGCLSVEPQISAAT
jgi:hypothetical protein